MNILIAGAKGQLGDALQHVFQNETVIPLDRGQLDITRLPAVREAVANTNADVVINAAAYNNVDRAETEPEAAFLGNEFGPRNLAIASAERSIPIVHVSTDYVFDGFKRQPYNENDATNPLSAYGRSKLAGEAAVIAANPRHYVVRTAWVYHVYGKNFLKTMYELSQKGPVKVVNDQFSSPTYAPHLADGIAQLMRTEAYGTYHLTNQGAVSRFDQLVAFYRALGLKLVVNPISIVAFPQAARRPAYSALTTIKTPQILLPRWEEGISEFARAFERGLPR